MDDINPSRKDSDDTYVRAYGHEASLAARLRVAKLIDRYYAAEVAGNGGVACSLVSSRLAKSVNLAKAVPSTLDPRSSSALYFKKTCAQVESALFEVEHNRLIAAPGPLLVTSLRVRGRHGHALLGFKASPERQLSVALEDGRWKIDSLLDEEIN